MSKGNSLKLAIQMFARQDSKWGGLSDSIPSTGEFIKHSMDVIDIYNASKSIRTKVLPFSLNDDALDEYDQNLRSAVRRGNHDSTESAIASISRRLETAEFKMEKKNLWSSMTFDSVLANGEPLGRTFTRLKKNARRL